MILPKVFVPIAEDTGMVGKMTDKLLEQAVHDAKNWPDNIAVSLNFSGRQISDAKLARGSWRSSSARDFRLSA